MLLVLPVIVRFSAICEHKYNVLGGKLEESTATIILSWWERMLLPRLHFNYHIYHHYYPGVAFTNLPNVHALFEKEGLVDKVKPVSRLPFLFSPHVELTQLL